MKEGYKQTREQYEKGADNITIITDADGGVVATAELRHRVVPVFHAEQFTDRWTGRPRVFTEEEETKYGIK
jgi:hypothetical protein